jgi:hypothetical protein
MISRHRTLNDAFIAKQGVSWLAQFDGRPALSTFRSQAREFASFEEFLLFLLLSNKKRALCTLGHSKAEIHHTMVPFADCGRYLVSHGKSRRTFCSM